MNVDHNKEAIIRLIPNTYTYECQICGSDKVKILPDTGVNKYLVNGVRRRRKVCLECGYKFKTIEVNENYFFKEEK